MLHEWLYSSKVCMLDYVILECGIFYANLDSSNDHGCKDAIPLQMWRGTTYQ